MIKSREMSKSQSILSIQQLLYLVFFQEAFFSRQINTQFIFETSPKTIQKHQIVLQAPIDRLGNTDPDSRKLQQSKPQTRNPNSTYSLYFFFSSLPIPVFPNNINPSTIKRYVIISPNNFLLMRSYIYPTNNFGNHNNTHFYFYSRSVTQGNNWSSYGLHQLQIVNDSDSNIEVVGWTFKEGRVEEDFKTNVIRPGLFYTARLVPNSWGTYKSIIGALTVKVQGTNQFYTIAFEDPFHDYVNRGYKGHIEEGNNTDRAISNLKDHNPKIQPWGRYEFAEFDGRGKTVFTITNRGR